MHTKKWNVPVLKAARWGTPLHDADGNKTDEQFENWVLWVRARDLPLDLPLDPNARHPDITKATPRAIMRTLRTAPAEFVKRNTGICMVARACHVKDNVATLMLNMVSEVDEKEEGRRGDGILNGGHTYAVLRSVLAEPGPAATDAQVENAGDPGDAVVRVEVQTGVSEDELAEISRARNKSEPVQEFSLKNLGREWQAIKNVLPKEVRSRVAFMENDPDAPDADYDVGDLIKLLALFNSKLYPVGKKDPTAAYTNEKNLIAKWNADDFKHLLPRLMDFIRLHDEVVLMFPKVMTTPGNVNGVVTYKKSAQLVLLSGKHSKYFIPPPFTFPVLAALRAFITDEGEWAVEPDTLVSDPSYIKELVAETWGEYKRSGRSSSSFFGRNRQNWKMLSLLMMVRRQAAA